MTKPVPLQGLGHLLHYAYTLQRNSLFSKQCRCLESFIMIAC